MQGETITAIYFTKSKTDRDIDWNEYGRYCGTASTNSKTGLGYVYMSTAESNELILVQVSHVLNPIVTGLTLSYHLKNGLQEYWNQKFLVY